MREEQDLNRNRQTRMQHQHHSKQNPRSLVIRRRNDRVQIPEQEGRRQRKPDARECVIESCSSRQRPSPRPPLPRRERLTRQRTPADQRHGHPDQIRIPIQTPALHQPRTLRPEPLQHSPQPRGNENRISIHQPCRPRQQSEVIRKVSLSLLRQIRADRPSQEQYHDHRGRDPERSVEVRIALQDIEEVLAWEEGGAAAVEDLGSVDVEELLVEG